MALPGRSGGEEPREDPWAPVGSGLHAVVTPTRLKSFLG